MFLCVEYVYVTLCVATLYGLCFAPDFVMLLIVTKERLGQVSAVS